MIRNYLRVRGEYVTHAPLTPTIKELPPRARRIQAFENLTGLVLGTTSACAENTLLKLPSQPSYWNYLRVRGEYAALKHSYAELAELPPRARRIRASIVCRAFCWGTTSACAENTARPLASNTIKRNYLRVRGEY